jgi:hypothetical protein
MHVARAYNIDAVSSTLDLALDLDLDSSLKVTSYIELER